MTLPNRLLENQRAPALTDRRPFMNPDVRQARPCPWIPEAPRGSQALPDIRPISSISYSIFLAPYSRHEGT